MKKNIIAIVLVFAMLFAFGACKRLPQDTEGFVIESKVYVVDDDGINRTVYNEVDADGKTVYYYFDTMGNKIIVDKKDVVVETTKVAVTTTEPPVSLTPEEQSFFDMYNDPNAFENLIDSSITEPEMDISDEPIPEDSFEKIEVELDSEGKPVHGDIEQTYEELLKSKKFTLDVVFKGYLNGTETIVPMKVCRNGDKLYMETALPVEEQGALKCNIIIRDEQCYFVIPGMRAYMTAPAEEVGEMFNSDMITEVDDNAAYVSSAEVEFDGEKYLCDVYEADGATSKYYYQNGDIKRVEITEGESVSIIQFNEISSKVDNSVFKVPTNYMDITKFLNIQDLS